MGLLSTQPGVCVCRTTSLASSLLFKSHPRAAQRPWPWPWPLLSPLPGNLPPHLVNCLSQKFHSAATLGSQEQHDTNIHSCDEVIFTSP